MRREWIVSFLFFFVNDEKYRKPILAKGTGSLRSGIMITMGVFNDLIFIGRMEKVSVTLLSTKVMLKITNLYNITDNRNWATNKYFKVTCPNCMSIVIETPIITWSFEHNYLHSKNHPIPQTIWNIYSEGWMVHRLDRYYVPIPMEIGTALYSIQKLQRWSAFFKKILRAPLPSLGMLKLQEGQSKCFLAPSFSWIHPHLPHVFDVYSSVMTCTLQPSVGALDTSFLWNLWWQNLSICLTVVFPITRFLPCFFFTIPDTRNAGNNIWPYVFVRFLLTLLCKSYCYNVINYY